MMQDKNWLNRLMQYMKDLFYMPKRLARVSREVAAFKKAGEEWDARESKEKRDLAALQSNDFWSAYSLRKDWLNARFRLEYNPDSMHNFNMHPQAKNLFQKFLEGNPKNNAGDFTRFYSFILNLEALESRNVPGDFAELGVFRGSIASVLADYADRQKRQCHFFDTFTGFDKKDLVGHDQGRRNIFTDTSLGRVQQLVGHKAVCHYHVGFFPDSIPAELANHKFAFVSIDCDLYQPMKEGLEFFYPRMSPGGLMFLHDYSSGFWPGCKQAIDEFISSRGLQIFLLPDKSGSAILMA